jgi:hypothetical protein
VILANESGGKLPSNPTFPTPLGLAVSQLRSFPLAEPSEGPGPDDDERIVDLDTVTNVEVKDAYVAMELSLFLILKPQIIMWKRDAMIVYRIVFHEKYFDVYSSDPASAKGRFDGPYRILKEEFEFVRPTAASEADLQLLPTVDHIERIRRTPHLYEIATLAVGGGILASEIVIGGGVAFALIRPPGHHASPNSLRWVFCFFNNIAIAVKKLLDSGRASRALIVDFDLHFGDGTSNTFRHEPLSTSIWGLELRIYRHISVC